MDIAEVRANYPEYKDMTDEQIARGLHAKFYSDMPYEDFAKKVGVGKAEVKAQETTAQKPSRSFLSLPESITNPSPRTIAADPFVRFAVGAGENVAGLTSTILRGMEKSQNPIYKMIAAGIGGSRAPTEAISPINQIINQGRGENAGSVDIPRIAGNILSPSGLQGTRMFSAPAAGYFGRVGQAAGAAGIYGAAQPFYGENGKFDDQKAADIVVSTVLGAGVQGAVVEPIRYGVKVIRQFFTDAGLRDASIEYMKKIVGGEQNFNKLVDSVNSRLSSIGKGPLHDYKPKTGELIADIPEASPILAMTEKMSAAPGGPSAAFGQRAVEQSSAINRALGTIAKTPEELNAAIGNRASDAATNYADAYEQIVKRDSVLRKLWKDPFFKKEIGDAWDLFKANNPEGKLKDNFTEFLQYVKFGLDKQLSKTGNDALTKAQYDATLGAKNRLIDWLGNKNPAYDFAREAYKEASVPINQMQVGQALQKKLVSPTGRETPGTYLRAIDEETKLIKNILGQPRQDLGSVLTPAQQETVQAIGNTLERQLLSKSPIQRTSLTGETLDKQIGLELPSILSRPVVLANWMLKILSHGKSSPYVEKMNQISAEMLLNPESFVAATKMLPPDKLSQLMAMMREAGIKPPVQMISAPSAIGIMDAMREQP